MIKLCKTIVSRFRRDERGVTLVEYGIAIALAIGLGTAALSNLGDDIGDSMDHAGTLMPGAATTTTTTTSP